MASAALAPYCPARFSALPSLGDAASAFAPRKADALPRLVRLVHAAELSDVVGVALLHAHFDMSDTERLVLQDEARCMWAAGTRAALGGRVDTRARPKRDRAARASTGLASPLKDEHSAGAVPTMFAVAPLLPGRGSPGNSSEVVPLEFTTAHLEHYAEALAALLAAPGFVAAYAAALRELRVDHLLGLALLPPASECALRGRQLLYETGVPGRGMVTTVHDAGWRPADAVENAEANEVVWVAPAWTEDAANEYAVQRACNVRNTRCRDKPVGAASAPKEYAVQRACNVRNTRCRDKPTDAKDNQSN